MRFNRFDLNQLVALDALLTERSVTKAAERLNLSPSAMSNALARLREFFNDELLVQVGRRMEATPRAESLQAVIRDVLTRVDGAITMQPGFDPSRSERVFRLCVSDYTQLVLVPHLLALANEARCTAQFEFLPMVGNPQRSLERGEVDLLIMPRGFLSSDHPDESLYSERFTCVVWRDSILSRGELTFERYIKASHVVMKPASDIHESFEAGFVKRFGVNRRVAVTTYGFSALPAMVVGTDLIATVHLRLAQRLQRAWDVVLREPPFPIATMEQGVQWHRHRSEDHGLVWLRSLLARAVVRMDRALLPGAPSERLSLESGECSASDLGTARRA